MIVFDFAAINRRLNRKPEPSLMAGSVEHETLSAADLPPISGRVRFENNGPCAVPIAVQQRVISVSPEMAALRAEVEQMERELDAREAITQNKANG